MIVFSGSTFARAPYTYILFPARIIIVKQLMFAAYQKTVRTTECSSLSIETYETAYPILASVYNAINPFRAAIGTLAWSARSYFLEAEVSFVLQLIDMEGSIPC